MGDFRRLIVVFQRYPAVVQEPLPSWRTAGEAIRTGAGAPVAMDCFVALLLAMTMVGGKDEPENIHGRVSRARLRAPAGPVVQVPLPSWCAAGETIRTRLRSLVALDCFVALLLAMTMVGGMGERAKVDGRVSRARLRAPAGPVVQTNAHSSLRAAGEAIQSRVRAVVVLDCFGGSAASP